MTLENTTLDTVWFPGDGEAKTSVTFDVESLPLLVGSLAVPEGHALPALHQESLGGDRVELIVRSAMENSDGFTMTFRAPVVDGVTLWRPGSTADHGSIPASWVTPARTSPLNGVAAASLVGLDDRALLTFAATAGEAPIEVRAGLVEETAELLVALEVPAGVGELRVHIEGSGAGFSQSVARAGEWLWQGVHRPDRINEQPVFCTWYFAHQDIQQSEIIAQAKRAAGLGFRTLIIDDGWQTSDRSRGYGSSGDWRPDPKKLPDPAELVEAVGLLGLRTIWWVGTPFLGYRSDAIGEDELPRAFEEPSMDAAIIDLRSVRARRVLVGRLAALLKSTGAHGLKVDFLDRFATSDVGPRPLDGDVPDLESGALRFLDELNDALTGPDPAVMIEFREPYIGPIAGRHATMLRVGDCPLSPLENRLGIVDLRLIAPGRPVHSDPVMWSDHDSPERVAQHLANALFGVPQVSVDLVRLSLVHRDVLAFWMDFWTANAETLLHGTFTAHRPDLLYPLVEAGCDGTIIIARYAPTPVTLPTGQAWRILHIVNADTAGLVLLGPPLSGSISYSIFDARGECIGEAQSFQFSGPCALPVPSGGLLTLTRDDATE
ncbi:hypothetical protein AX769_03945 [Frondihabitans sp. PAMC 28766]|uniref:alpha-galactosidase n=1 Tax=Frondihabitans sp. PAMC 28766 TaxID=1795630 RepID=UPI00078E0C63|nr:alpha-galactosidase [Frondihabitans sp. PAMC 28766]AMM19449.1 hypothetical protein AX769_03945 [Frondihabitans sp. PAMC 28766]